MHLVSDYALAGGTIHHAIGGLRRGARKNVRDLDGLCAGPVAEDLRLANLEAHVARVPGAGVWRDEPRIRPRVRASTPARMSLFDAFRTVRLR